MSWLDDQRKRLQALALSAGRAIKDIPDANSQGDQARRLAANQPRYYQDQQAQIKAQKVAQQQRVAPQPVYKPPTQNTFSNLLKPNQGDSRSLLSKTIDQVNPFDSGRDFFKPGVQKAPNWLQRNASPTGGFNIAKEVVQGTARIAPALGMTINQTANNQDHQSRSIDKLLTMPVEERKRAMREDPLYFGAARLLGSAEPTDEVLNSKRPSGATKSWQPSGWQKRLFGDEKIETYPTQGRKMVEDVNKSLEASGTKFRISNKAVLPAGVVLMAADTFGGGKGRVTKYTPEIIEQFVKATDPNDIIKIATRHNIDLGKNTKKIAENLAQETNSKKVNNVLQANGRPLSQAAADTNINKQAAESLPTADVPTTTPTNAINTPRTPDIAPSVDYKAPDIVTNFTKTKDPTQTKSVVATLFPKLDPPSIEDISAKLAKTNTDAETAKVLDEAKLRSDQLTETIDSATAPKIEEPTLTQQVETAPVNPTQPEVPEGQLTSQIDGVNNATDPQAVQNAVEPMDTTDFGKQYKPDKGPVLTRIRDKFANFWDPKSPLRKEDKYYAKKSGIKFKDLQQADSMEQLYSAVEGASSSAQRAIQESGIFPVLQKYRGKTQDTVDLNTYSMAMHDLERREAGRKPIFNMTKEQLIAEIEKYRLKNPDIDADARALSQGYKDIQKNIIFGEDSFVDTADYRRANFKNGLEGEEFAYYRPVKSMEGVDLHKPEVKSGNMVSTQQQKVIQESSSTTNKRDYTFNVIEQGVENMYKQRGMARLGRLIKDRAANDKLKDGTLKVEAADTERLGILQKSIKETRDILKSYDSFKKGTRLKVQQSRAATNAAKASVIKNVKREIRAEAKATVENLKKALSRAEIKATQNKGKLGVPQYKTSRAEVPAIKRARQQLIKDIGGDPDSTAAVNALSKKDMLDLFESMANDVPAPKNTRAIYKKILNARKKMSEAQEAADNSAKQVDEIRNKLTQVFNDPETSKLLKDTSDADLMLFGRDIIDNDLATPATRAAYQRFIKKDEKLAALANKYQDIKLEMRQLEDNKKGMRKEVAEIRESTDTYGLQVIHGLDSNGNKFTVEISKNLAEALQRTPFNTKNPVYKFGRTVVTGIPRAALVGPAAPIFQTKQAIYNTTVAPMFHEQGYRVLNPRVLKDAFMAVIKGGDSDLARSVDRGGVVKYGGVFDEVKYGSNESANNIAAYGSMMDKIKNLGSKNPAKVAKKTYQLVNEFFGNSDRFARMQAASVARRDAIKKNLSQSEIDAAAAAAYRKALPEFSNVANSIRGLDSWVLFAGASQAGTRQVTRAFATHPYATTRKMSYGIAPAIAMGTYLMADDGGQEYVKDLRENDKTGTLDNNIHIKIPWMKITKNEDTGEWGGFVKIPIAPELRPLNKLINDSLYAIMGEEGTKGADFDKTAPFKTLFHTLTGGMASSGSKSPTISAAINQTTNRDQYGNVIRDTDMSGGEKLLKSGQDALTMMTGTLGKAINAEINKRTEEPKLDANGNPKKQESFVSTYTGAMKEAYYGGKGSTSTSRYYKNIDKAFKELKFTDAEKREYESMFMNKSSKDGREKDPRIKAAEAKTLLAPENKKFRDARELIEMKARKQGAPANPFYDLTKSQQDVILRLQGDSDRPGDPETTNTRKQNEKWINEYYDKSKKFYGEIYGDQEASAGRVDFTGMPIPTASKEVEAKQAQYRQIADKGLRAEYLKANPDLVDFWDEKNAYQRYMRDQLDRPQFDKYPKATPEVQGYQDEYNSIPKGDGPVSKYTGKATSPNRNAWIKANPEKWAKLTEHWTMIDIFNLQEEGAQAVYENTQFTDDGINNILDIAKYINDNNGSSSGGSGGYSKSGYSKSGKSGKTSSGAETKDSTRLYLNQLLSGVPTNLGETPMINTKPTKVKFKVKTPSGKGRNFKRIKLN